MISASLDDSSFQMTIYGGEIEDIYVLSIPSFTWIKVEDIGNTESSLSKDVGRFGPTCDLYRDRQMIVLGGDVIFNRNETQNDKGCNTSYPAIRVLDVTNFTWQTRFSPLYDPYKVPEAALNIIGGKSVVHTRVSSSTDFFYVVTMGMR